MFIIATKTVYCNLLSSFSPWSSIWQPWQSSKFACPWRIL